MRHPALTLTQARLLETAASGTGQTPKRKTVYAMEARGLVNVTGRKLTRKRNGGYKLCYDYTVTAYGRETLAEANKRSVRK